MSKYRNKMTSINAEASEKLFKIACVHVVLLIVCPMIYPLCNFLKSRQVSAKLNECPFHYFLLDSFLSLYYSC
jgi:hypothetical protein